MKIVRSVAYAVIVICALLCIVIAFYASRDKSGSEEAASTSTPVTVSASDASGESTVPNLADLIKDHPSSGADSGKTSISGNLTGEIDYDEIVKRQEAELDRAFRETIAEYNKKYGIVTSTTTSTTATVSKDYKYFVNKETKIIHRIDCLLKPVKASDTLYYETITEAGKAGYTERCPVCSP
ncbi:MAG: hypothetical protein IKR39_10790 [Lachnospiraceae bacterium]|nr:hypothetical protein [Lachnospiraceae bacterium]